MRISWQNSAGEIDRIEVDGDDGEKAAEALVKMVRDCGVLHSGDVIIVTAE